MDHVLTIEVGREPKTRTCDRCGRSAADTMGFVYRDWDAYAIYYGVMHRHEDIPQLDLAVGIGTWENDDSVADLSAFLTVWSDAEEIKFGFVDPSDSIWADARLLQNKLAANEARTNTSRKDILTVAELVARSDPAVADHLVWAPPTSMEAADPKAERTEDGDWPFDQGRNVGAITVRTVLAGHPIVFVSHDADDHGWQFLDGREPDPNEGRLICMLDALALDPTLRSVADLPPGWIAWRKRVGDPWNRAVNPRGGTGNG